MPIAYCLNYKLKFEIPFDFIPHYAIIFISNQRGDFMKPKSVLCLVLILAMLALFPVGAFAAQAEPSESAEETTAEEAASGQPGEAPSLTDDPAPVFPAPAKGDIVLWDEEKGSLSRILIPGRPNESETAAAALLAEYLQF